MTIEETLSHALQSQFHSNVRLQQRRPNIFQVYAPFYHEDGDMLDMYIEPHNGGFRVCDYGKTLMRLSYSFDLDTENKRRIFHELLTENQVEFNDADGNIYVETNESDICNSVFHFSQVVAKVSKLDVLRREVVSGLFFEMVDEFIEAELAQFNPRLRAIPMPGRDDLEVTCEFAIKPRPIYLFAVRNISQARLATIAFLEFQRADMQFKGYVVHDDIETLASKDRTRLTSAADKQFVSLDDFREKAVGVILRDAA